MFTVTLQFFAVESKRFVMLVNYGYVEAAPDRCGTSLIFFCDNPFLPLDPSYFGPDKGPPKN